MAKYNPTPPLPIGDIQPGTFTIGRGKTNILPASRSYARTQRTFGFILAAFSPPDIMEEFDESIDPTPGEYTVQAAKVGRIAGGDTDLPEGTDVQIEFDASLIMTDLYWDSEEPGVLTIPEGRGGIYLIGFQAWCNITGDIGAYTQVRIQDQNEDELVVVNASTDLDTFRHFIAGSTIVELAEGDQLSLWARHFGTEFGKIFGGDSRSPILWLLGFPSEE